MMKRRWGRIINIASVVGLVGNKGQANYAASKAGLIGLTKSVAADFVGKGVRCNCICPGTVDTPSLHERMRAQGDYEKARAAFIGRQPMGRLAQADEIAALVTYLASDESGFVTGQAMVIDGGISI